jgi:hypothetical protein
MDKSALVDILLFLRFPFFICGTFPEVFKENSQNPLFFYSLLCTLIFSNLSPQKQSSYPFIILVSLFGWLWILAKVLMFLFVKCKIIHDTLGHLMEAILNKMIYFLLRDVRLYFLNFSKCIVLFNFYLFLVSLRHI